MSTQVLFLSRSEVTRNLDPRALVGRLGEAFRSHSISRVEALPPTHHYRVPQGVVSSSPVGQLEGIPMHCVKVESRLPGGGSGGGLLHLFDSQSGKLLALMESSYITALGSALTGTLATDLLASPEARCVAIIGNGTMGWLSLRFLMEMRSLEAVELFDLSRRRSQLLSERLKRYGDLTVRVCDSLGEAVANADIICTSVPSERPYLYSEMVKPGAHVTTLGSGVEGYAELSSELLEGSAIFCDDRDLAMSVGILAGLKSVPGVMAAELGEILAGEHPGRQTTDEITVYSGVGLPFVDLVSAWVTYRRALDRGVGRQIDLTGSL